MVCTDAEEFALTQINNRIVRLAKSCCRFSKRIENRLQMKCRPANDLEYVGGGSLLLEGFT